MALFYNVEYARNDIEAVKGDDINIGFNVTLNGIAYVMTGFQIDIHVKRKDGLLIKSWSSAGLAPDVIIIADAFFIVASGFLEAGYFDYDVQVNDGVSKFTIMRGSFKATKEITI